MPVVAQLVIQLTDAGAVSVEGCIDNKLVSFGLLEIAKESVTRHHTEKERLIQPATAAERLATMAGPRAVPGL